MSTNPVSLCESLRSLTRTTSLSEGGYVEWRAFRPSGDPARRRTLRTNSTTRWRMAASVCGVRVRRYSRTWLSSSAKPNSATNADTSSSKPFRSSHLPTLRNANAGESESGPCARRHSLREYRCGSKSAQSTLSGITTSLERGTPACRSRARGGWESEGMGGEETTASMRVGHAATRAARAGACLQEHLAAKVRRHPNLIHRPHGFQPACRQRRRLEHRSPHAVVELITAVPLQRTDPRRQHHSTPVGPRRSLRQLMARRIGTLHVESGPHLQVGGVGAGVVLCHIDAECSFTALCVVLRLQMTYD